jgi:hypothetical protein
MDGGPTIRLINLRNAQLRCAPKENYILFTELIQLGVFLRVGCPGAC